MPKQLRASIPGRKSGSLKKQKKTHSNTNTNNKHNQPLITELTQDNGYFKPAKHTLSNSNVDQEYNEPNIKYSVHRNPAPTVDPPGVGPIHDKNHVDANEMNEAQYVDPITTNRILKQVNKQKYEPSSDNDDDDGDPSIDVFDVQKQSMNSSSNNHTTRRQRNNSAVSIDMSTIDSDSELDDEYDDSDIIDTDEINNELEQLDELQLNQFYSNDTAQQNQLADKIYNSIEQHTNNDSTADHQYTSRIPDQVRDVYSKVGVFLSHYTSGKIPKAFKIIPVLQNWEEILYLTTPDSWTVQSTYIATKLFTSNLNPKMAQRFYSLILLPKIQQNIAKYKKLNYHLYQAICKTLYKPAAFFKGILLPLAQSCTLRDAIILSSILNKNTIPLLHSSVAILKLCDMAYNTQTELFIKTLINKKYNLPYRVIDRLVQHFVEYHQSIEQPDMDVDNNTSTIQSMPVVWHQSLLLFIQRYKYELSPPQIKQLKQLIKIQQHHSITPEIKKELYAPKILDSTKMKPSDIIQQNNNIVVSEY